jgi:hypothetical protein
VKFKPWRNMQRWRKNYIWYIGICTVMLEKLIAWLIIACWRFISIVQWTKSSQEISFLTRSSEKLLKHTCKLYYRITTYRTYDTTMENMFYDIYIIEKKLYKKQKHNFWCRWFRISWRLRSSYYLVLQVFDKA